jgi:hypothetical protein
MQTTRLNMTIGKYEKQEGGDSDENGNGPTKIEFLLIYNTFFHQINKMNAQKETIRFADWPKFWAATFCKILYPSFFFEFAKKILFCVGYG